MRRAWALAAIAVVAISTWWLWRPDGASGQQATGRAHWIWLNEGDPAKDAPKGTVYFRKVFTINRDVQQPVDEAALDITADGEFTVWVNGALVGKGNDWKRVKSFDVKKHLVHGQNVIAVEAKNTRGTAGLLARLGFVPNGMSKLAVYSDGSWKASKTAADGWQQVKFDEKGWSAVKVMGKHGMEPWGNLTWDAGGDDRFSVPPGFKVELAVKPPANDPTFSLVNMCFDARGRLLVSREGQAVMLCTEPDKDGVLQKVVPYCTQVTNCQGMCWIKDALYLVGNGPKGTGLYRCRDTKGEDKIDDVKLLHAFKGGMGEHGPHAILHGPDDMLYVVIGNHAWANIGPDAAKNGANPEKLAANSPLTRWPTGGMGPDQGKKNTTEDVLLPRLDDGRGHAAGILAPGGTIWRMDHEGKNMALVACGFRNHFDAAFAPNGELFTFDSDMEWDENLPWYRAVRVCHCPPGADFVWRTGAANTPDYYIDSLPPIVETGRGSPVGLEFYDHYAFPAKYRGAYFMADWAIGVIFAVHLERDGASYKTKVERFCAGAPMNITDLNVGPDGALWFVMGGRGSQGGVYRISYSGKVEAPDFTKLPLTQRYLKAPQPLSAWGRAQRDRWLKEADRREKLEDGVSGLNVALDLKKLATDPKVSVEDRLRAIQAFGKLLSDLIQQQELGQLVLQMTDPQLKAEVIAQIGACGAPEAKPFFKVDLESALSDKDALVRRRACEALVRQEIEPDLKALWPLLGDKDRFVRHAARLVLERIDPKKYADKVWKEQSDLIAFNGIIALCHTNKAEPYAAEIFGRLRTFYEVKGGKKDPEPQELLDWLRTTQLAMVHCEQRPIWTKEIAKQCEKLFPHKDWRVNRELAILLVEFQREGFVEAPIQPRLMKAIAASKDDRLQQIHYVYCMRLLRDGWTPEMVSAVTDWYEATREWKGGHSFTPFLENIYKDCTAGFSFDEKKNLLARAEKAPMAAIALAKRLQVDRKAELLPQLFDLQNRLKTAKNVFRQNELVAEVDNALVLTAISHPSGETLHLAVGALASKNPVVRFDALTTLRKSSLKPKLEDPAPFRTAITAAPNFGKNEEKWEVILLLRQWTDRSFGLAKAADWQKEHEQWALWFNQTFPKEPPLKTTIAIKSAESKYKFAELEKYLDKERGDAGRGKAVFTKANCIKCHKFGTEGEGVGPDLTTVAKRFKRVDILDSIVYPSKVISDQYRSVKITTKNGQEIVGLAAVQGDTVTVLLSDASKVTLRKDQIDTQVASLISVMPEQLLDTLTLQEIADLFAFLESEPQ
jgi:putative heme-binding domain-containing protein